MNPPAPCIETGIYSLQIILLQLVCLLFDRLGDHHEVLSNDRELVQNKCMCGPLWRHLSDDHVRIGILERIEPLFVFVRIMVIMRSRLLCE